MKFFSFVHAHNVNDACQFVVLFDTIERKTVEKKTPAVQRVSSFRTVSKLKQANREKENPKNNKYFLSFEIKLNERTLYYIQHVT